MASKTSYSKHTFRSAAPDESTPLIKDGQPQESQVEQGLGSRRTESSSVPNEISFVRMVLIIGPLMMCTFFAAMGKML